jgi:hypothetical protein
MSFSSHHAWQFLTVAAAYNPKSQFRGRLHKTTTNPAFGKSYYMSMKLWIRRRVILAEGVI